MSTEEAPRETPVDPPSVESSETESLNKGTIEVQSSGSALEQRSLKAQDLSVTALYTAQVWAWAGFEHAESFSTDQTRGVFGVTNGALAIMRLFRWKLPRLPEGLAQRHALIDHLVEERAPREIIELAAGLSSRALRLTHRHAEIIQRYLEVDLEHVISFKHQRYQELEVSPVISLSSQDLQVLTHAELASWIKLTSPPVVIAEGLVMYLKPAEAEALLTTIAKTLQPRGGRLIFDWVPTVEQPPPGLIGRSLGALMRLFTGGQTFQRDARTRDDMRLLLSSLGGQVQVIDTREVASDLHLPFAQARTQQLVFVADWTVDR